ncbi:MAG: hypothetical protein ABIX28_02520, partial [Vicinamibacterales bacterium]
MWTLAIRMTTVLLCLAGAGAGPVAAAPPDRQPVASDKLDRTLRRRADRTPGTSRVIVIMKPGAEPTDGKRFGAIFRARLEMLGSVLDLPNAQLTALAARPEVESIHEDRPVFAHNNRVAVTVGARTVQESMGFDGRGIGIAVIDSGVTSWHDDLTDLTPWGKLRGAGGQRVSAFV